MSTMVEARIRIGGLMRCCIETINEKMEAATTAPSEGDTLSCKYHDDNGGMIFRDGAWEWNRPEES